MGPMPVWPDYNLVSAESRVWVQMNETAYMFHGMGASDSQLAHEIAVLVRDRT